jgi:hypothetical protein
VTFEGKIYGQLTFKYCDYQLQKYVSYKVVTNASGRVTGIVFDVTAPSRLKTDKPCEFYFNIFLNDGNQLTVTYGTSSGSLTSEYDWDGNGNMTFNTDYSFSDRFYVNNCSPSNTLKVTCTNASVCTDFSWIVYSSSGSGCNSFENYISVDTTYTYGTNCQFSTS